MKRLWTRGKATVRELYGDLRPKDGDLAYTTVLSLLQTMEQKGLVRHEAMGKGLCVLPQGAAGAGLPRAWRAASLTRCSTAPSASMSPGRSSHGGIALRISKPWNG